MLQWFYDIETIPGILIERWRFILKKIKEFKLDKNQTITLLVVAAISVGFACVLELMFLPKLDHVLNGKRILAYAVMLSSLLFAVGYYFGVIKKVDYVTLAATMVLVGAAIGARVALFDYESTDYSEYIAAWVHQLKIYPGISRWKFDLGDYNMPYIYLLTLVAKQPLTPLYMVKMLTLVFDLLLAYFTMKISSLWFRSIKHQIAVFAVVLFFPTVIINSAYWGQCDAIYTAFAIGGIYYAVTNRPNLGVALLAISFSFKLQAVFVLPILAVLLIAQKIRFKHLLTFPATFFATLLPALLAGKPLKDTLMIYVDQTQNYPRLSMLTPNIYNFLSEDSLFYHFSWMGMLMAGAFMVGLIYFAWIYREQTDIKDICVFAFLFVIILPYFLPRMHERYFYMADILSLTVFFANTKRWYIPLGVVYASIRCYSIFLISANVNLMHLSILMLVIISISVYDLFVRLNSKKELAPGGIATGRRS